MNIYQLRPNTIISYRFFPILNHFSCFIDTSIRNIFQKESDLLLPKCKSLDRLTSSWHYLVVFLQRTAEGSIGKKSINRPILYALWIETLMTKSPGLRNE